MSRGQLPRTREFFPRMKDRRIGRYVRRYRNWRPRWFLGVDAIGAAAEAAGSQLLVLAESIEGAFADVASPSLSGPSPHDLGPGPNGAAVGLEVDRLVLAPISEVRRQVFDQECHDGVDNGEGIGVAHHARCVCGTSAPTASSRGAHPQLVVIDETPFYPQPRKEG